MNYREITNLALENEFLNSQGLTPAQTSGSCLGVRYKEILPVGAGRGFLFNPKVFFGLTIWQTQANEVFLKFDHHNQEIKKQYLQKLHEIKPGDFEILIGRITIKIAV